MNMQTHETGPEPQNRWFDHIFFLSLSIRAKKKAFRHPIVRNSDKRNPLDSGFFSIFFFFLPFGTVKNKIERKCTRAQTPQKSEVTEMVSFVVHILACANHCRPAANEMSIRHRQQTHIKNYINTQLRKFKQQAAANNSETKTNARVLPTLANRPDSAQHTNRFNWCGILSGFYHKHQHYLLSRITTIHIAWNMNVDSLLRRIYE